MLINYIKFCLYFINFPRTRTRRAHESLVLPAFSLVRRTDGNRRGKKNKKINDDIYLVDGLYIVVTVHSETFVCIRFFIFHIYLDMDRDALLFCMD